MKKIIFLLLLLLIPIKVVALEKSNDTIQKCQFYYLEKEYSEDFFEKGKNNKEFPNLGTSSYFEDKIHVSKDKPKKDKLLVEEVPVIKYQEHQKIRYIIIDQTYSSTKMNLVELEVYEKENKIPLKIRCDTCSTEFFTKIQNNIINYEYNYIANNTKIIIDLKNEYFPNDITLKLHFCGVDGKSMKFRLTVNRTAEINDLYFRQTIEKMETPYFVISENLKNIEHEDRLEEQIQEIKGVEEIENAKMIQKYIEYHYRNKVYQYYKETKHYVEGYYENLPGLIKDENRCIDEKQNDEIEQKPTIANKQDDPQTIKEYIETKVPVKINEIKKVPLIVEKIKVQDNPIEIEVPVEKIVEKNTVIKKSKNYPLQYVVYFVSAIFFKKMSIFNE